MAVLLFPFHQDERLSSDDLPLPGEVAVSVVETELPAGDQWLRLSALYEALAARVAEEITSQSSTTVVSGDCLSVLGTLAGVQRAGLDPSLVWFDGHGDLHTLSSSSSGYLGGLALRMALGGDADKLATPLGLRPVPESSTVLVDARDLDPPEEDFLAGSAIRRSSVQQLRPDDLPDGPVLLHVDLDVIDAAEIPGLRFPVSGGPSSADVLESVQRLLDSGRGVVSSIACSWFSSTDEREQRAHGRLLTELLPVASTL
jgi:arginase